MSKEMKENKRRSFIKGGLLGGAASMLSPTVLIAGSATPNQTAGPFYPVTPQQDQDFDLTHIVGNDAKAQGKVVDILGQVLDTNGEPVIGATVDIWQANAAGRYRHPHDTNPAPLDPDFQGWAIVQSGQQGGFKFKTIIPGAYPVSTEWTRPPHIHFKVSKTGYHEVTTQMYFPGHELNQVDRLLQSHSAAEQKMMIAQYSDKEQTTLHYNVVLKAV